jgi:hypothetical protein
MPETTMQGVSLYSRERGRRQDVFELALTYEGIEIRRPGEPARHLSWERVSEWEIEQRRGGVLLTLRGGGSVTPLIIPRWKVDDLDLVLRDVTSGPDFDLPDGVDLPDVVIAPATFEAPPAAEPVVAPDLPEESEPVVEPAVVEPVVEPVIEPVVEPVIEPVVESVIEPTIEAVLEPDPAPVATYEDVISKLLDTPGEKTTKKLSGPAPESAPDEHDVSSELTWPSEAPLQDVAPLSWPVSQEPSPDSTGSPDEFILPDIPPADGPPPGPSESASALGLGLGSGSVSVSQVAPAAPEPSDTFEWSRAASAPNANLVTRTQPIARAEAVTIADRVEIAAPARTAPPAPTVRPAEPPVVTKPLEGAAPRPAPAVVPPRAARRKQKAKPRFSARMVTAIVLLALLAAAVALVLAQSAGAIHLTILGPAA